MRFFDNFRRKKTTPPVEEQVTIPREEVFIEKKEPKEVLEKEEDIITPLRKIYKYAETDFENKGYNDALVNDDTSYCKENIKLLQYDLYIIIKNSKTEYEHFLKDIDFHIKSRSAAGLSDTVEELKTKKEKLTMDYDEVVEILEDYKEETGICERIALSYMRGFKRGLVSISTEKILEKKL